MHTAKIGIMGKPPTVKVEEIESIEQALADWCEKQAEKNENHYGKYLTIAAKLRELERIRPYVGHTKKCPVEVYGNEANAREMGKKCECGFNE